MNTEALSNTATAGEATSAETVTDETKVTPEIETTSQEPEAEHTDDADAGDDDAGERKRLNGSAKWRMKAYEAQAALAAREAELAEVRKSLGANAPIPGLPPEPKEADYPDFFEYQAQRSAWLATKALLQAQSAAKEPEEKLRAVIAQAEAEERLLASAERARKALPDFDAVLSKGPGMPVPESVVREVRSSEKAALIEYNLCRPENAAVLRDLATKQGVDLVRAVARLEGRWSYPKAKTSTSAPEPLTPLGGGSTTSRDPSKMTYKEFVKYRENGGKISIGG
jgi:hypothetical protein